MFPTVTDGLKGSMLNENRIRVSEFLESKDGNLSLSYEKRREYRLISRYSPITLNIMNIFHQHYLL